MNMAERIRELVADQLGPLGPDRLYRNNDIVNAATWPEDLQSGNLRQNVSNAMSWWTGSGAIVHGYRAINTATPGKTRKIRFVKHDEPVEEDVTVLKVGATIEGEIKAMKDDGTMLIELYGAESQLYKLTPLEW